MKQSKYWLIIKRLVLKAGAFDYSKHETKFLKNMLENTNPYDPEELTEGQKSWLLKLNKKYRD